jgi:very-short-patch-repair endonuclease
LRERRFLGLKFKRQVPFWNNDVLRNTDGVLEFIALTIKREALEPPHPAREGAPTSPQRGEG